MRKVLCKIGNAFVEDWDVEWNWLEDEYPFCKEFYHQAEWGKIVYKKLTCLDNIEKEKKLIKELEYGEI